MEEKGKIVVVATLISLWLIAIDIIKNQGGGKKLGIIRQAKFLYIWVIKHAGRDRIEMYIDNRWLNGRQAGR